MREIKLKIYTFDELSEDAKEKARDWYRAQLNTGDFEPVVDDIQAIISALGFDCKLQWRGFYTQGDGACFVGSWAASRVQFGSTVNGFPMDEALHSLAGEIECLAREFPNAVADIKQHTHMYQHEHTVTINYDPDPDDILDDVDYSALDARFTEVSRGLMKWAYRCLDHHNDWLQSDKSIDENCVCANFEFLSDGSLPPRSAA